MGKFRPMDVYPCVADETWSESKSIRVLFGDLCSGSRFFHDEIIMRLQQRMAGELTQDGNMGSPYQSFSQSIDNESQYENEGTEEMNKYAWYERFGVPKALGLTKVSEAKSPSPTKSALKRRTPGEEAMNAGLLYPNCKRIRPQVEGSGIKGADGGQQRTKVTRAWSGLQEQTSRVEESVVQVSPGQVQNERLRKKTRNATTGAAREGEGEGRGQKQEQVVNGLENIQRPVDLGGQWAEPHCIESREKPSPLARQGEAAEDLLQEGSGVNGPPILHPDVEVEMKTAKKHNELQLASHRLTPSHTRVLEATLSTLLDISDGEQSDPEALLEAALSALGLEGKTWWDVELESTRPTWRYRKEVEL